jgi:hypothetical protein
MSAGGIDDELREHFQALREVDLAEVPSFAELTRRPAGVHVARRTRAPWVLAGGLGALAAASMLTVLVQRRQEAALLDAAAAISRWRPPTDVLLAISSRTSVGEPDVLRASVLDSIIPAIREE